MDARARPARGLSLSTRGVGVRRPECLAPGLDQSQLLSLPAALLSQQ